MNLTAQAPQKLFATVLSAVALLQLTPSCEAAVAAELEICPPSEEQLEELPGMEDYPLIPAPEYDPEQLPYWFFLEGNDHRAPNLAELTPYIDLHQHWSGPIALTMIERGVFSGKSATEFAPDFLITRAEFITSFCRAVFVGENYSPIQGKPWYAPFEKVLREKLDLSGLAWGNDLKVAITPHEISHILKQYAIAELDYEPTGTSIDTNSWVKSSIFTPEITQSGMVTRAVAATVLHDLCYPGVNVASGVGYLGISEHFVPSIPEQSKKLVDAIAFARTAEENEEYRIISSKQDPLFLYAFHALGIKPEDVEHFALSYDMTSFSAYTVGLVKPKAESYQAVWGALENHLNLKHQALMGLSSELLAIIEDARFIHLEDGTLAFVMAENAGEIVEQLQIFLKN